ncbi:MAG: tetratricopeptide repeat protein [Rhodothermales bacterium]|nr:tetratricopeptide repeat protein [Rhodothermales bacterium]
MKLTTGKHNIKASFWPNIGDTVRLALLILLSITLATTTLAQQSDADMTARFQLADSYLRSGQYDRAIPLLQDLYRADPASQVFFVKLKQGFENTKRYEEAIALVDSRIELEGPTAVLLAEKGRFYFLDDQEDRALLTWNRAVDTDALRTGTYLVVYNSMVQSRLYVEAIALLESGREAMGNETLFRKELGRLYGLTSQPELAMSEYLGLIEADPRQLGVVKSRVAQFSSRLTQVQKSIDVVEDAVRDNPLNRQFRELLAWFYLEADMYAEALDVNRAIDRMEKEEGRVLFGFASRALSADEYDVALSAYEEILERYPDAVVTPEALRGKGETFETWANKSAGLGGRRSESDAIQKYRKASEAYIDFLARYPGNGNVPYVMLKLAGIEADVFDEPDSARVRLTRIIERYPNHPASDNASFQIGRMHLLAGELNEAFLSFSRLEQNLRIGELAEDARFELARIHFYRGDFESSQSLVEALKENTSTDIANNAIELKLLLIENKGPDSLNTPLTKFASARLLERQRKYLEALSVSNDILAEYANHQIADDTRYLRAGALMELGRKEEAVQAYEEIPLMHPQSFLVDRSLFSAAEIYEIHFESIEKAIEMYNRIVIEHPGSLLVSEARTRIRLLRGDDV